jgi:hypothetical protein
VPIPFEPQRQVKQPVDVRQGFRLEGSPRVVVGEWRSLLCHQNQNPVRTAAIEIISRIAPFIPCSSTCTPSLFCLDLLDAPSTRLKFLGAVQFRTVTPANLRVRSRSDCSRSLKKHDARP